MRKHTRLHGRARTSTSESAYARIVWVTCEWRAMGSVRALQAWCVCQTTHTRASELVATMGRGPSARRTRAW
eukprot:3194237-Pleurochrysis_carterae.AAC.4